MPAQSLTLVDADTARKWDAAYASGTDKKYPNLDLVRLEKWHFKSVPGRLLEYAFGCGENLIHMLECGYTINAVDASLGAKRLVERKIAQRPAFASRVCLLHIEPNTTRLPFDDASFDYVTCLSVLSLLGSRERTQVLLREFQRVMRSGAKLIVDINGPKSDFARYARPLGGDVYETVGRDGREMPHRSYCPPTAEAFAEMVEPLFSIDDIGYSSHRLFHSEIQEFIVCAHKTP